MQGMKTLLKITFIVVMIIVNIYLVAWPSISKYLQGGVVIEVSTQSTEGLVPPAVSFRRSGLGLENRKYEHNGPSEESSSNQSYACGPLDHCIGDCIMSNQIPSQSQ